MHENSLTTRGVDVFILLEPSDICLCSFILHATKKREGENWINQMLRGMGMEVYVWGKGAAYP